MTDNRYFIVMERLSAEEVAAIKSVMEPLKYELRVGRRRK
jgi:hypothetical protein